MKWRPNWGVEGDGAPANTETWAFPWTVMISEISTIDLDETGAGPWHHLKEKQNSELSVFNGKCNQYETSNAESCYIQYEIRYGTVSYELIIMIYYYYYTTWSIWYCMTVYEEPRGAGWACSISCQISFSASSGSPESAIKKLCHSIEWSLYGIEQPAILAKELFHHPLPPWGVKLVLAEEMKNATAASSGIAVTPSSNFNSSGSLHALQLPTKSSSCRRGLSGLLPPSSPIPMILCKELRLKIKQKKTRRLQVFWLNRCHNFSRKNFRFFRKRHLAIFLSSSCASSASYPCRWFQAASNPTHERYIDASDDFLRLTLATCMATSLLLTSGWYS